MGQQTRFFMNDGDWLDFLNHAREAGFTFLPQLTPTEDRNEAITYAAWRLEERNRASRLCFGTG